MLINKAAPTVFKTFRMKQKKAFNQKWDKDKKSVIKYKIDREILYQI